MAVHLTGYRASHLVIILVMVAVTMASSLSQFERTGWYRFHRQLTADTVAKVLEYPGDSKEYPRLVNASWTISSSTGMPITIVLTIKGIQESYGCYLDHLDIRDGSDMSSMRVRYLCGSDFHPRFIKSSGPHLFINFVSDDAIGGKGFILSYQTKASPTTTTTTTTTTRSTFDSDWYKVSKNGEFDTSKDEDSSPHQTALVAGIGVVGFAFLFTCVLIIRACRFGRAATVITGRRVIRAVCESDGRTVPEPGGYGVLGNMSDTGNADPGPNTAGGNDASSPGYVEPPPSYVEFPDNRPILAPPPYASLPADGENNDNPAFTHPQETGK